MHTLVIATDGSAAAESATAIGLEVANALGDRVVFISVWQPLRSDFGPLPYMDSGILDSERERAELVLGSAMAQAAAAGVDAESVLAEGDPVTEICKLAGERQARLIAIGSHGWGALHSIVRGSVISGVMHRTPCAVLAGSPGLADSGVEEPGR